MTGLRISAFLSTLLMLCSCATVVSTLNEDGIEEDPTRRTMGAMMDDSSIETTIKVNLNAADDRLKNASISVVSYNGTVLLVGQVPSQDMKNLATRVATSSSSRVKTVHNELEIAGTNSLLAKTNDAWLSSKVKTLLLTNPDIRGLRTKVVAENGVIYLMGLVSRAESQRIVDVVSSTRGVNKVVRAFEYVDN